MGCSPWTRIARTKAFVLRVYWKGAQALWNSSCCASVRATRPSPITRAFTLPQGFVNASMHPSRTRRPPLGPLLAAAVTTACILRRPEPDGPGAAPLCARRAGQSSTGAAGGHVAVAQSRLDRDLRLGRAMCRVPQRVQRVAGRQG